MHDLHEADKILKVILQTAQEHGWQTVKIAEVELGNIMEHDELIKPANLKFNLKMLAKGTLAEKMIIMIKSVPGNTWIIKSIEGE